MTKEPDPEDKKSPSETSASNDSPYNVGYRKPPKHSQFKKGISGNPKGKPKEMMSLKAVIVEELNKEVTVMLEGKPQKMSLARLTAKKWIQLAAKSGNPKAIELLIRLIEEEVQQQKYASSGKVAKFSWSEERDKALQELTKYVEDIAVAKNNGKIVDGHNLTEDQQEDTDPSTHKSSKEEKQ